MFSLLRSRCINAGIRIRPSWVYAPTSKLHSSTEEILEDIARATRGTKAIDNKCSRMCSYYSTLDPEDRRSFLIMLAKNYGVDMQKVSKQLTNVDNIKKDDDTATKLEAIGRLRHSLLPRYHHLFTLICRLHGGVKFLVDLRQDSLNMSVDRDPDEDWPHLVAMDFVLRDLLSLWFSVGFMELERITWTSSCEMLQKISEYEAVHPISSWTELKQRVGPYRRCFIFTHAAMPKEPIVVLHTALTSSIPNKLSDVVHVPRSKGKGKSAIISSVADVGEDPEQITTAVFYSITSTQKGLQGVELGNYLIRSVVKELVNEFPKITYFSSLSPIPGFKNWLLSEIVKHIHHTNNSSEDNLLLSLEKDELEETLKASGRQLYEILRQHIVTHAWKDDVKAEAILKGVLMRLCARYLYQEKKKKNALNDVANFHLRNGAMLWRLNWMADPSTRGLSSSCGIMCNYRYFLEETEANSQSYMEDKVIIASEQVLALLHIEATPYGSD